MKTFNIHQCVLNQEVKNQEFLAQTKIRFQLLSNQFLEV